MESGAGQGRGAPSLEAGKMLGSAARMAARTRLFHPEAGLARLPGDRVGAVARAAVCTAAQLVPVSAVACRLERPRKEIP